MQDHSSLLTLVRAVCVLDGFDVEPSAEGVRLTGLPGSPLITWSDIEGALASDDPVDPAPRLRLTLIINLHRQLATLGDDALRILTRAARPLALPVGHPLHSGPGWVREAVPGGVLDLGVGVSGLVPGQDGVVPVPASVAVAVGYRPAADWPRLLGLAERIGDLTVHPTDQPAGRPTDRPGVPPTGPLAPAWVGGAAGCDALTLLAVAPVRAALLAAAPDAVRAAAPGRDRVWLAARPPDPDYLRAVWLLTAPARRGVREPLSVDPDGVRPVRATQRSGSSSTRP